MSVLVLDPVLERHLQAERRKSDADCFDEVWEGVYMTAPLANDEHQALVGRLTGILQTVVGWDGEALVRPGVNISDRIEGWEHNYRCPDVVVFMPDTATKNLNTHWVGGPDLAIEITSPGDRTRDKLPFYAAVGTRELVIVDRDPWSLELFALDRTEFKLAGRSTLSDPTAVVSMILPLTLRLADRKPRPQINNTHRETGQSWTA